MCSVNFSKYKPIFKKFSEIVLLGMYTCTGPINRNVMCYYYLGTGSRFGFGFQEQDK